MKYSKEYVRQPALERRGGLGSDPSPAWGEKACARVLQAEASEVCDFPSIFARNFWYKLDLDFITRRFKVKISLTRA